jgi:hypothetical protein
LNNKNFLRFAKSFTIYILVIAVVSAYPIYVLASKAVMTGAIANTILFYVITLAAIFLVIRAGEKKGTIVNAFLSGTVVKILLAMIYLLVFLKSFPGHEMEFALTFFAAYLICTGFEVYWILKNLKQI